jgi:hypothetical protein
MDKPSKEDPMLMLLSAMLHSDAGRDPSEAIYEQERRGQQQLCASESLPAEHNLPIGKDSADALRSLGIEAGDPFEDDPLFRPVKLPAGWEKVPTDHPYGYWTNLLDDKGRERAHIFYKAAIYDRRAHISFVNCINATTGRYLREDRGSEDLPGDDDAVVIRKLVGGESRVLHRAECTVVRQKGGYKANRDFWAARDKVDCEAKAWVEEHYPDHNNPAAYWDDDE